MKHVNLPNHPDVVMLYQERDNVEAVIESILELNIEFKAYKLDPHKFHDIARMEPKVLLLSSNDIKHTIRFYIDYLEDFEQDIAPHSAVILINNREMSRAYLACENGLFDNYAIINPLNDPYRLKIVLLKELELINNHNKDSLNQLISEGEDELASCIEHGAALKKSFLHEVNKCEEGFLSVTDEVIENQEVKAKLQKAIGVSVEGINENLSSNIQVIIDQLEVLKNNGQLIKQNIEKHHSPKVKTTASINTDLLTAIDEMYTGNNQAQKYKLLIAEPSDLFNSVIEEIFADSIFNYLLINDGEEALVQISAFKPDVILLAYDLPNITGLEITKLIRTDGNKVPIVAYTHHRDKAVIKNWIPLGLSDYLIKPSKKSLILKSVTKAVEKPVDIIHLHIKADKNDIVWIPEYSVGNKELDEQHKALFAMTNDFFNQNDKKSAIALFQNLSSYIDLHFEAEESLMRQINYPETDEHVQSHDKLRAKFIQIQDKLDDYDIDLQHKIAMFLYNWLSKHILKSDMKYKAYALSIEVDSFNR